MKQSIYIVCILMLLSACDGNGQTGSASSDNVMNQARQAYWRANHRESYALFEKVWADADAQERDRAEAGRSLAKMDWRFYEQTDKALQLLDQVTQLDEGKSKAYILKARVLSSEDKHEEAVDWATKAKAAATSETEKYEAVMAHGGQLLAKAEQSILANGVPDQADIRALQATYDQLQTWMTTKLGDVQVAELNLAYALLLGKGADAFDAWMAYYRYTDKAEVHPSLLLDVKAFEATMKAYKGEDVVESVAIAMVKGLAESGFYNLAALMKVWHLGSSRHADQRINEIMAYRDYQLGIIKLAAPYYRELIGGRTDYSGFNNDINDLGRKLWRQLEWEGEQPGFATQRFRSELKKRFKGYLARYSSGSYYGVHLGQVVLDDNRIIRQYGKEAEFRYYLLDHMVSNGYTSWFGDGDNEVGGWAPGNGSFLQVRTTMTTAPVMLWQKATDPQEQAVIKENIEEWTRQDEALARNDPYAFLQGLKWHLMDRELGSLLDSLKGEGLQNEHLRFAFISRIENIMEGSAIYAHEGRHAIDQQRGYSAVSADLEFTAKLSEVYFSERPFLSIQTMLGANRGGTTPHGIANLRVIKGLVNWMEAHQDEIAGFDPQSPTQPQLGKLSTAQLRAAVRSMDPMAD